MRLSLAASLILALAFAPSCDENQSANPEDTSTPTGDTLETVDQDLAPPIEAGCTEETTWCEGNVSFSCVGGKVITNDCGTKGYCNFGQCVASAFELPKDGAPHNNIIEWWYYTGHVKDDTHDFGFELALFQQDLENLLGKPVPPSQRFGFMCHVAILDKTKGQHAYTQGIATKYGSWSADPIVLETLNCHVELSGDGHDHIVGSIPEGEEKKGLPGEWRFDLDVDSIKPVAHHGIDGLIPMSVAGDSYYYSFTRMDAAGQIITPDGTFDVTGQAWMDHQWGDFETMAFKGWDWWSMQFDDGWEIMLFQFRDWDGVLVEQSGTLIDPDGYSTPLDGLDAFTVTSLRTWASTETDGIYPLDWDITIKELDWNLQIRTDVDAQEMPNVAKNYWEGATRISGTRSGVPTTGLGYVELTGYATDLMNPN